jgi:hypothetical protein
MVARQLLGARGWRAGGTRPGTLPRFVLRWLPAPRSGYTLPIWTSGAVLSHAHGIPAAPEALLFLLGAVAGYALVGSLAFSGDGGPLAVEPASGFRVGCLHFFSVGLAIGATSLVATQ